MKPSEFSLWRRKYSILKYRRRIQFKWQMESKQRHRYQNENLARAPKGAKKCQLNPYKMDIAWNYSTKLSTTNAPAAKAVECFSTFQHKIQIDPFEHLSCQFFFLLLCIVQWNACKCHSILHIFFTNHIENWNQRKWMAHNFRWFFSAKKAISRKFWNCMSIGIHRIAA